MTAPATSTGARARATATASAIPTRPVPSVIVRIAGLPLTRWRLFDDALGLEEIARDVLRLHLLAVDLVIHCRHVRFGQLRADLVQDVRDLRVCIERVLAHDRDQEVGRPKSLVVLQAL